MSACCPKVGNIIVGWTRLALNQGREISAQRMVHCTPCEHNQGNKCMKCPTKIKCRVKAKTRVESEFCPIGKWHAIV
jgi:hypothetical protein